MKWAAALLTLLVFFLEKKKKKKGSLFYCKSLLINEFLGQILVAKFYKNILHQLILFL